MAGPHLEIPESTATVSVSVINTTSSIKGVDAWKFIAPTIKGHEYLATPAFSFLITHEDDSRRKRRLLFDLGIRKDWCNSSPFLLRRFRAGGYEINVDKSVKEILQENGADIVDNPVEAIIWSHWHWDHTGNPNEFPPTTQLIVGPGFKQHILPGYPANPDSSILESDYNDRELKELNFEYADLIGGFRSIDYFGDGSFYLLDTPGHAIGHLCGLARVSSNPDSFVFLGGDIGHQPGEWRPSAQLPLPEEIQPNPFTSASGLGCGCPGSWFEDLGQRAHQPHGPRTLPFYAPARLPTGQIHHDIDECIESIRRMQQFDGASTENIFVVIAHDASLLDTIDFFPKTIDDFMEKGWIREARWKFLRDFAAAVGYNNKIEGVLDWSPGGTA
jgi:glyoxylase-like metal-dependent hydrolase (beta-lactamase superfamily II)